MTNSDELKKAQVNPALVDRSRTYETICEEADRLVTADRQKDYGHPLDDYTKVATIWGAILGVQVTPEQAALCMIGVKISREANRHKRDNLVDMAGYAKCVDMIHMERVARDV